MPNFNGDVVFVDTSGQVRAQSGDLTLRGDSTNTRSIIVGSGVALRPDRDLFIELGRPDLRWLTTHTGHLAAHSGYLGVDPASATPYPTMEWNDQGFSVQGDFPVTKSFLFTQIDVGIAGATLQLIGGSDLTVDGNADFQGGLTGTLTSSRVVPANDSAGNDFASIGAVGLRYDAMYAGSGVFNHLAPPTSGTFIVVEDGDLVPIVDARRAIGVLGRRWARMHAASGIFNTIGASVSGTRVDAAASFVPNRNAIYALGTSTQRWANIFASSGNVTTLDASTINTSTLNATSVIATTGDFSDVIINRSLTFTLDGFPVTQIGQLTWDIGGNTLDFINGVVNFETITTSTGASLGGGTSTDTLTVSSTAAITGTLTTRNIVPQTDRLYAIGTSALRYSRMHAASGVFNTLSPQSSGTYVTSVGSIVPERDALYSLGTSVLRWENIFAASGTINTLLAADITAVTSITSLGSMLVNGLAAFNGGTFFGNATAPSPDASYPCGLQGFRWSQLYAVSGFIESLVPLPSGGFIMTHGRSLPGRDMAFDLGTTTNRWGNLLAASGTFTTRATIKSAPIVTNQDARTTVHGVITANSGAIINANTERDIYNYTIPANTLSASGKLLLELVGSVTNMSASNVNFTPRVYIDGTNIWGDVFAVTQGPRPADFAFYLDICSLGSLTGQRVRGSIELGTRTAGSVTGNGDFGTANVGGTWSSVATSGTANFANPINVRVSMQLGTASTLASYSGFHGILMHQPFPTLL